MKKFFFADLILLICVNLSAQLTWLNPTPSGWLNTKIHFINNSTGYLMNYNGDLFITKDTGNTWQSHGNFPGAQTFLLQDSIGIMPASDGSIFLSSDNGATWKKSISSPGNLLVTEWCDIVGRDTLFILTNNSSNVVTGLYRSINRGLSWQLITNNVYPISKSSIDFVTSKTGYALKPDGIYKTIDGGVTWQHLYLASFTCLKFYDSLRGIAYSDLYGMLRTTDGGLNWKLSLPSTSNDINDIFFVDTLNIFASGDLGVVYKTTDGGVNWTFVPPTPNLYGDNLYTQYFFDANNGIVAGLRGRLLRTRDGGASWEKHSPTYDNITGISFGNETTGYATTWYNLYKTVDAGKTWSPLTLTANSYNNRFEYCRFTSGDTGIVTTVNPVKIHKTTDGGQNWTTYVTPVAPTPYDYISSMSFFSKDTGYISLRGPLPALYKTMDGGSNWKEVGTYQNFNLLFFLSDQFGYATIYDRVYRTSDGGVNWLQLPVPPAAQPFTSMWFINPAKGFTVGRAGQLKMTLDSGYSWTDIFLEPYALPHYSAISFYNDRIGYTTDEQGGYYKTIDGGHHWKKNGTVAYYDCRNILFRPDTTVLFAGLNGAIASRNIADYSIDSVQVVTGACNAELRAKISAFLSPVDSIWFEYGKVAYTDTVSGSPSSVADTILRITTTLSNLQSDSIYHARVKVLFKSKYYYSPDFTFKPQKNSAPVITASGNILSSSVATGNQWYLNGTPIVNATNQQYSATVAGAYTVIATQGNCATLESAPFNHAVLTISVPTPLLKDIASSVCGGSVEKTGKLLNPVPPPYTISIVMDNNVSIPFNWVDSSFNYSVTNVGNHSIRITYTYQTSSSFKDTSYVVKSTPVAGNVPTQSGNVLTAPVSGNSYQWYLNAIAVAGATNQTITILQNGTYSYTYSIDGCTSQVSPSVNALLTSIIDPTNNNAVIIFFPNPTSGSVFIKNLNSAYQYSVKVIDHLGTQVRGLAALARSSNVEVDLRNLQSGTYVLQLWNMTKNVLIGNQQIILVK